jgi:hypothetical protein
MGQWDDGEMGRWGSSTDFCCNMLKKEAPRKKYLDDVGKIIGTCW